MTTPDLIASHLVDGPHPADRTLPLIDRDAADGRDFLTVSRKVYRGLVASAVREALAERDAEVGRLTAERDHHERQQIALLYGDLPKLRAERDALFQQRCDLLRERDQLVAEVAALRAQPGKPADDWPSLTHQMRDRLFRLCQEAGVVRENQWLSEAACEAIEKLRERVST